MKKYLRVFIIVFIGYFVGDSIYSEMSKDKIPGKAKRLPCQKKVTSFERGFSNEDIIYAQRLIEHGSISFSSRIEKPIYQESVLFKHISLEQTDMMFENALKRHIIYNEDNNEQYQMSYYIYENDKKDPGKKTEKSKKYAGYTVFEVKDTHNKTIYKMQVDFMDTKGTDIKNSIECVVKSFMTFNK